MVDGSRALHRSCGIMEEIITITCSMNSRHRKRGGRRSCCRSTAQTPLAAKEGERLVLDEHERALRAPVADQSTACWRWGSFIFTLPAYAPFSSTVEKHPEWDSAGIDRSPLVDAPRLAEPRSGSRSPAFPPPTSRHTLNRSRHACRDHQHPLQSLMSRPILPDTGTPVPSFDADLERDIDATLAKRLGRAPTDIERMSYREYLWALAVAIRAIVRAEPPSPSLCPAPPSTSARAAKPRIASH
jgi:hypothetical protein